MNQLLERLSNLKQLADLYNDRSQECFNVGDHIQAIRCDKRYLTKIKQIKRLELKISQKNS